VGIERFKLERLMERKEFTEQKKFVEWLELKGYMFTATAQATPSGSYKFGRWVPNFKSLRDNKQIGVRKGFPDLCVILPNKTAVFIEMKRADGVRSDIKDDQWQWNEALNDCGIMAAFCFGFEEARDLVLAILENRLWNGKVSEFVPETV
jgi:hypothetical protein